MIAPAGGQRLCPGAGRSFCGWTWPAAPISGQQLHVREAVSLSTTPPTSWRRVWPAWGSIASVFTTPTTRWRPRGIWKAGTPKKNEFDPGQLDRLDYFIAALKRHGIYANINLHISRNYWEGEDFPDGLASNRERQEKLPNYGKGLDKINDQMIRMQRDYARALLTHVNPYTGTNYAKEPCVAIVEINNENSLLQLKDLFPAGILPC